MKAATLRPIQNRVQFKITAAILSMHMGGDSSTAVLIFANSPEQELCNKPHLGKTEIFDTLTEHTLKTVRKTGLPYFHFTEREQKGPTFAEKFVHAIVSVFEMGFSNIITIGNDAPQLTCADLLEANKQLQKDKIVLGPSADGGIYLMGIQNSEFSVLEFLSLPWKTSNLFRSLFKIAARRKDVVKLSTLFDLDNLKDLELFISRFSKVPRHLLSLLIALFKPPRAAILSVFSGFDHYFGCLFFNKGSPLMIRYFRACYKPTFYC
jgi:glycosyltransferase A (GT-A) superfamily protein (DUF2064 family)